MCHENMFFCCFCRYCICWISFNGELYVIFILNWLYFTYNFRTEVFFVYICIFCRHTNYCKIILLICVCKADFLHLSSDEYYCKSSSGFLMGFMWNVSNYKDSCHVSCWFTACCETMSIVSCKRLSFFSALLNFCSIMHSSYSLLLETLHFFTA